MEQNSVKITERNVHTYQTTQATGFALLIESPDRNEPKEKQCYRTFARTWNGNIIVPMKRFAAYEGENFISEEGVLKKAWAYLFDGGEHCRFNSFCSKVVDAGSIFSEEALCGEE